MGIKHPTAVLLSVLVVGCANGSSPQPGSSSGRDRDPERTTPPSGMTYGDAGAYVPPADAGTYAPPSAADAGTGGPAAACTTDADCGAGGICYAGVCEADPGSDGTCTSDADCGPGGLCYMGYCEADPGTGGGPCFSDADCGPYGYCFDGYCEDDSGAGGDGDECFVSEDCYYPGDVCTPCPYGAGGAPIRVCLPPGEGC